VKQRHHPVTYRRHIGDDIRTQKRQLATISTHTITLFTKATDIYSWYQPPTVINAVAALCDRAVQITGFICHQVWCCPSCHLQSLSGTEKTSSYEYNRFIHSCCTAAAVTYLLTYLCQSNGVNSTVQTMNKHWTTSRHIGLMLLTAAVKNTLSCTVTGHGRLLFSPASFWTHHATIQVTKQVSK